MDEGRGLPEGCGSMDEGCGPSAEGYGSMDEREATS